jgi:hypothetical protein
MAAEYWTGRWKPSMNCSVSECGQGIHPTNEDVHVDFSPAEGYHFFLDQSRISLGDLDLWAAGTLIDTQGPLQQPSGGLKLPTGSFEALSGSGGADLAWQPLWT